MTTFNLDKRYKTTELAWECDLIAETSFLTRCDTIEDNTYVEMWKVELNGATQERPLAITKFLDAEMMQAWLDAGLIEEVEG